MLLMLWVLLTTAAQEVTPLGATWNGQATGFRVWAPHARQVELTGSWRPGTPLPMTRVSGGIWEAVVPDAQPGHTYRFILDGVPKIDSRARQVTSLNGESVIVDPNAYRWGDAGWKTPRLEDLLLYEVHVGTFSDDAAYRAIVDKHLHHLIELRGQLSPGGAPKTIAVHLMPVHTSSGEYLPVHFFAPRPDAGRPDDLRYMVDRLHQNGFAVLLDVVYTHTGHKGNVLWRFDGWKGAPKRGGIYFYNDERAYTKWGETRLNYTEPEVRRFVLDNLRMWMTEYHIDGFRLDGPHLMDQLPEGWELIKEMSHMARGINPNVILTAERFGSDGVHPNRYLKPLPKGADFDAVWGGAWWNDLPEILLRKPNGMGIRELARAIECDGYLNTRGVIQALENHDTVALHRGAGRRIVEIDPANPYSPTAVEMKRLGTGLTLSAPGTPLIFMGEEFLEVKPFAPDAAHRLDWSNRTRHADFFQYFKDLVAVRFSNEALTANNNTRVTYADPATGVIAYRRHAGTNDVMMVANLSDAMRSKFKLGLPRSGHWREVINSDNPRYGGQGRLNASVVTQDRPLHGFSQSAVVDLPPRTFILLRWVPPGAQSVAPHVGRATVAELAGAGRFAAAYLLKEALKAVEARNIGALKTAAGQLTEGRFWIDLAIFSGVSRAAEWALLRARPPGGIVGLASAILPLAAGMAATQIVHGEGSVRDVARGTFAYLVSGMVMHGVFDNAILPLLMRAPGPLWLRGAVGIAKLAATLYLGEKLEDWLHRSFTPRTDSARRGILTPIEGLSH